MTANGLKDNPRPLSCYSLVRPHARPVDSRSGASSHSDAKRILQEAIYNDTKYLCSQGIMDYSLLLGLDNQRNELVVGLVDAIGSFNLFKTIESRGKLALTRGGEVTIVSDLGGELPFVAEIRSLLISIGSDSRMPFANTL